MRISLEQESQRRVSSHAEADRLRFQHAQLQQSSSLELSNLRKALDDLRFQNDENICTINLRNDQLAIAQRETVEVKTRVQERDRCIEELRASLTDVENKNRQLSDRINDILYTKAKSYKEKTIDALKRSSENIEPNQMRESDLRFKQTLQDERVTTSKVLVEMQRKVKNH